MSQSRETLNPLYKLHPQSLRASDGTLHRFWLQRLDDPRVERVVNKRLDQPRRTLQHHQGHDDEWLGLWGQLERPL